MRFRLAMIVAAPLFMAGCGTPTPEQPATQRGERDSRAHGALDTPAIPADPLLALPATANGGTAAPTRDTSKVEGTARYSCAGGLAVLVNHDLAWDVMHLTIGTATFELTNMLSDTDNKYRSETGRAPGRSLMWQTKGEEAKLIEGPKAALPDSAEQKIIACRRVADPRQPA